MRYLLYYQANGKPNAYFKTRNWSLGFCYNEKEAWKFSLQEAALAILNSPCGEIQFNAELRIVEYAE